LTVRLLSATSTATLTTVLIFYARNDSYDMWQARYAGEQCANWRVTLV